MSTPQATPILAFPDSQVSLEPAFLRGLPSPATRRVYRQVLGHFQEFLGSRPLISATRRDVEAYRAILEESGRAPATIAKSLSALSGFFIFGVEEEAVDRNPVSTARRPKLSEMSPRRALAATEVKAIIGACDIDTLIGLRDRAMMLLLAVQGWRAGEVLRLCTEDLHEEQGHKVAVVHGKGGTVIRVPLAAASWSSIWDWCSASGVDNGPIFIVVGRNARPVLGSALSQQSLWKRVALLGRRAGIDRKVHPHLFRHTAITEALDAGVPLHQVQDLARHRDPSTTRRYDSHRHSLRNPAPHVLAGRLVPDDE
jgi:integrase/recombinase XerD